MFTYYLSLHAMLFDPGELSISSHSDLDILPSANHDSIGTLDLLLFRGSITRLSPYGLQFSCLRLNHVVTSKAPRLGIRWVGTLA
jgi:hypothetical protein